jgi:CheY-like chemotaxis protein
MSKKILVVDDDQDVAEALEECLIKLGYEVLRAENGVEAIQLFDKNSFVCLFCDLRMPEMDGVTFIGKIHNRLTIPFFFMTGFSDYPVEELRRFSPRGILFKPFSLPDLKELMAEI